MSPFLNAVSEFIAAIQNQKAWVEELNDLCQAVGAHLSKATPAEVNDALQRHAGLFPEVPLVAVGLVALNCGSLVERGGDPGIAGPALLDKLPRILDTASAFYDRCWQIALEDTAWLDELRQQYPSDDGKERANEDVLEEHIANDGWNELAGRFGPVMFQDSPESVLGHMSEDFFRLGLIAHLSRSKPLRARARERPELLEKTQNCDAAACGFGSFLHTMLRVLDDEPLIVLHVDQRKGFRIRIGGIADNFQLHTLLAGTLIGSPAKGLLKGEAPSPKAVAQCRDKNPGAAGGENVTGAFNLWNWTGLQPEITLPKGQTAPAADHWIWNEGCPADIRPFEGQRTVLLGPPPYTRHWRAGRQFSGMVGELSLEANLSTQEVDDWLARLAAAPRESG
jgi:hypothetical protein